MANGERHGMHKLTDAEVNALRTEYAQGGITQRALAKRYGCSQAQVNNVLHRKQRANDTHILIAA
jgi:antitoxin component HigA of HigAB toxin-antitoxin module